jgi:diaminohydroxyphosphoribosylaminopyrimidine deaminase/5-amino-6-(5-phosphoribosylamino)uracil reductase
MDTNKKVYEMGLKTACAEARKWLGTTSPNPPVGAAALDIAGKVLAVAAHQCAGEAHAEAALLAQLQKQGLLDQTRTLCITLEPCNHQGRTPPCTEAIIAAGIKRVVIGTSDPNPHVTGGGIERLQQAGIEAITGVAENECQQLIHAFAYNTKTGKPWITIKRAFNRDGSMLPPAGQKTFTSEKSLILAHQLRKKADVILTGSGTILADNPEFTVRHVPDYPSKQRFLAIMDRRKRVSQSYLDAARQRGFEPIIYGDIESAIKDLAAKGAQDMLVEAGPDLAKVVLDSHLWNMSVTIRSGDTDSTEVKFNPDSYIPFNADAFNWNMFLPT